MGDISGRRQVIVRLDAGFLAEVDAARGSRSRQALVEGLLRDWMGGPGQAVVREVVRGPRMDLPAGVVMGRELAESPVRYRCPERSCGFVAPSSRATCRVHGRKVVGS